VKVRVRAALVVAALVAAAAALKVRETAFAAGPRILVMEGGKHRVFLVDRASHHIIAEKADLSRVDCVAQLSASEFVVCEGWTFVRLNMALEEQSRTASPLGRVGNITIISRNRWLLSDIVHDTVDEIDGLGNQLSSIPVHYPSNALQLTNGNVLVADGTPDLKEFDPTGQVVRRTALRRWAASLDQPPGTGELLVGESLGYERFDVRRRPVWFRESESRASCIQGLPAGEILLCEPDRHRVVIVDRDGHAAWELGDLGYPWRAVYVP
jgi:hypothetical protein